MAQTNLTSYASLMKRAYKTGVAEQINQEVLLYDLFAKSSQEWNGGAGGESLYYAVHTRRAGTAANIGDGGNLPNAGTQTDKNLVVTAKTIADRVEVSTKLMKAAPSSGSGAFLGYMDGAVNRLINDVKALADRRLFDGGVTKGLLNQHKASNLSTGAFVGGGAGNGGTDTWEFSGDLSADSSAFAGVAETVGAALDPVSAHWVRVRLRRMDTYAEVTPTLGGGGAVSAIFVSGKSRANNTINLTVVSDVAGTGFTTATVADGYAIALEVHNVQLQDAVPANFGTIYDASLEQEGMLTNLCSGVHKTVDRTTATGETVLQSTIFTMAVTGTHGRAALSAERIQSVLDEVNDKCGQDPTTVICNPTFRSKYAALLTPTPFKVTDKAGNGDIGFSGFSLNGQAFKTSQRCAKGILLLLNKDSFEVAAYDDGGWMDKDGAMLSRVSGKAAYEAAYTWDWDLVCVHPNQNGILCGVKIA